MIVYPATGFEPHGQGAIKPLPEGGWFVYGRLAYSHHFRVYVDKVPDVYFGCRYYRNELIEIIDGKTHRLVYNHNGNYKDRVPHRDYFSTIISPVNKIDCRENSHIPSEIETIRAIVNAPEDKYSLVVSKKGGSFVVFELPIQDTANSMVSCDGQTILVAQKDLFTIFDNPLD